MRDDMILNRIYNNSLGLDQVLLVDILRFISLWSLNFLINILVQVILFKDKRDPILPCSEFICSLRLIINLGVVSHFEMRTSNGNSRDLDLTNLRCLTWFRRWVT